MARYALIGLLSVIVLAGSFAYYGYGEHYRIVTRDDMQRINGMFMGLAMENMALKKFIEYKAGCT